MLIDYIFFNFVFLTAAYLAPDKASRLRKLYEEYEDRKTIESIVTKELDILDLIVQAFEYEKKIFKELDQLPRLDEFFRNMNNINTPELATIRDEVVRQRNEFHYNVSLQVTPTRNGTTQTDANSFTNENPLKSNGYMNLVEEIATRTSSSSSSPPSS